MKSNEIKDRLFYEKPKNKSNNEYSLFEINENIFVEYLICKECNNPDAYYICLHCGKCGRAFDGTICKNIAEFPPYDVDDDERYD